MLFRSCVTDEETVAIIELLFSNCIWLIGQCHVGLLEPEEARTHYVHTLELLRRTFCRPAQAS